MKQSNLKVCITGLTISVCLLTGSALATAKAGNWSVNPSQHQEQDLFVMDTKFRVELARVAKSLDQDSDSALSIKSAQSESPAKKIVNKTAIPTAKPALRPKSKSTAKKEKVKLTQPKLATRSNSLKKAKTSKNLEVSAMNLSSNTNARTLEIPSGKTIEYKRLIPVKATAYTAAAEENGSWGPYDYYGNPLKLGTIAVDPDVIPMGSTVFITGYSFDGLPAKGMFAKAMDQGSAIQGKRVDIFVPTTRADASKFGMQDVKIYIME